MSRKHYTVKQVAALYEIDEWRVRALIRQGRLGAVDLSKHKSRPSYRISEEHLAAFDQESAVPAA